MFDGVHECLLQSQVNAEDILFVPVLVAKLVDHFRDQGNGSVRLARDRAIKFPCILGRRHSRVCLKQDFVLRVASIRDRLSTSANGHEKG